MIAARTSSVGETRALAGALAALARPGDLVLLCGDLGAGKTAFAQGFGAALGVVEPVTSPTFTLVSQHRSGRLPLYHVDVYRLDALDELADLGFPELLDDGAVTLVEWGDTVVAALPGDRLEVRLRPGDADDDRHVELHAVGPSWAARAPALRRAVAPWGGDPEAGPC